MILLLNKKEYLRLRLKTNEKEEIKNIKKYYKFKNGFKFLFLKL